MANHTECDQLTTERDQLKGDNAGLQKNLQKFTAELDAIKKK